MFKCNQSFLFSDTYNIIFFVCPFIVLGMYNQAFLFCEKVKERLCSQDDYQAFLKCLNMFSNGIIQRKDLQNLVGLHVLILIGVKFCPYVTFFHPGFRCAWKIP
jgi:hypothetical protein